MIGSMGDARKTRGPKAEAVIAVGDETGEVSSKQRSAQGR